MNILKTIKNLYKGEDTLAVHVSIFALTGFAAISFVNIISLFLGHSIYSVFAVPSDEEAIVFSILAIMIFIFFTGYKYKYVNSLFKDDNSSLPSVSMDCFSVFVKLLPIFFVWLIYFLIFFLLIEILFEIMHLSDIQSTVLALLLLPFINSIIIMYSKDFKAEKYIFNPLFIFKIIKELFFPVMLWFIQFLLLFAVLTICFKYLFTFIFGGSRYNQLVLTLLVTCISGYIQEIINLAYFQGITEIIKNNYPKES